MEFVKKYGLKIITIEALINYRIKNEKLVRKAAEAKLPTIYGDFRIIAYENTTNGEHHLRNYGIGAQILHDLGVRKLRLLTNNPKKLVGLSGYGLEVVERVPLQMQENDVNKFYLMTKKEKMGHLFDGLDNTNTLK